jgi:ribosomal protein S18 acetylase RimI-like enzyme
VYRATFRDQQAGKRFMLLAVANGFPIGQVFGHWQHIPAVFAPAQRSAPAQTMRLYLYSLRVLDMFQGMGIGTSLLTTCEAMARERRARALGIAAAKDNPRARALYERVGYCVIGQDDGRWSYVDHTGRTCTVDEPCWVLEKSLRIG